MSKEIQEIIIDLNNSNNATEQSLIPPSDILYTLLKERLNELETGKYECTDIKKYKKLKRHDSILIDGTRGAGKSTILKTLYKQSKNNKQKKLLEDFYILETLDPNQLDNKACFLSLIIDNIFEAAEIHKTDNLELFNEICNLKTKIDELSFKLYAKQYNDSNELSLTTKEERKLDETIHIFACKVAKLINKTILIQPIDDVDMELTHGTKILETIRKYLQTPRIIPIIALDSSQIYGMIKKEQFTNFGFKAKTPLSNITDDTQMEFLKKLPSEYIQKILPPSQTIVLDDMLEYYKRHVSQKDSLNIKFKYKNEKIGEIILDFTEILKLILNILYEFYDEDTLYDPEDFHIVNYLKNKTFRSFIDDARAILNSLKKPEEINEQNKYEVDYKTIKNRFKPYHTFKSSSKHDAVVWFWEQYIKKLEHIKNNKLEITNITEEIIKVTPKDSENSLRKEKTYYRLIMQEFYLDNTEVIIESKTKITKIKKTIKMEGFIELILKTFFPAIFLEKLIIEKEISLEKFPIHNLKDFSKTDDTFLINMYNYWIPNWPNLYSNTSKNLFGIIFNYKLSKYLPPFDFHQTNFNFVSHNDIFFESDPLTLYISPFKSIIFLKEFNNFISKKKLLKRLNIYIENSSHYLNNETIKSLHIKKGLQNLIKKMEHIKKLIPLEIENSSIGIFNSLFYVNKISENFYIGYKKNMEINKDIKNIIFKTLNIQQTHIIEKFHIMIAFKFNTIFKSIFINYLTIFFSGNESLDKSNILSGFKEKNLMLNYVEEDPFIHNINTLIKEKKKKKEKKFLKDLLTNIQRLIYILNIEYFYNFNYDELEELRHMLINFYKDDLQIEENIASELLKLDIFSRKYLISSLDDEIYNILFCNFLNSEIKKVLQESDCFDKNKKNFTKLLIKSYLKLKNTLIDHYEKEIETYTDKYLQTEEKDKIIEQVKFLRLKKYIIKRSFFILRRLFKDYIKINKNNFDDIFKTIFDIEIIEKIFKDCLLCQQK